MFNTFKCIKKRDKKSMWSLPIFESIIISVSHWLEKLKCQILGLRSSKGQKKFNCQKFIIILTFIKRNFVDIRHICGVIVSFKWPHTLKFQTVGVPVRHNFGAPNI